MSYSEFDYTRAVLESKLEQALQVIATCMDSQMDERRRQAYLTYWQTRLDETRTSINKLCLNYYGLPYAACLYK